MNAPLDCDRLSGADPAILRAFVTSLRRHRFTFDFLSSLTGKQMTRYIRFSPQELDYLRRQVLDAHPDVLLLMDWLLFRASVSRARIEGLIGERVLAHLAALGLVLSVDDGRSVQWSAYLALLLDSYLLNDGKVPNPPPQHVFAVAQEQAHVVWCALGLASPGQRAGRILDLCAGSGALGQAFQAPDGTVVGVEINPRAVAYARFNACVNGFAQDRYILGDVTTLDRHGQYDVVLANPPYNAYLPGDAAPAREPTVHAGVFGDDVTAAIVAQLPKLLAPDGIAVVMSNWLLQDGELAYPAAPRLLEQGTAALLHQPIVSAESFQGLKYLFSSLSEWEQLPAGSLRTLLRERGAHFNEVCCGLLVYRKGPLRGLRAIDNIPTDSVLLSDEVLAKTREHLGLPPESGRLDRAARRARAIAV